MKREFAAELSGVISGSFKFKPEIDAAQEEFRDFGVTILAPEKGWLWLPPRKIEVVSSLEFRPLPTERAFSPLQVEDDFLRKLGRGDFVYIFNEEGYIGNSTAFEIGHALGWGKPMYSLRPIGRPTDPDDENMYALLEKLVTPMSISEAAADLASQRAQ